VAQNMNAK